MRVKKKEGSVQKVPTLLETLAQVASVKSTLKEHWKGLGVKQRQEAYAMVISTKESCRAKGD